MIPEQIDAMPAGRELDALVLVHVCGWKWWRFEPSKLCALVPPRRQIGDGFIDWATEGERFSDWDRLHWDCPPLVSTDIAAAWTVVEAMKAKGYSVMLWDCPDYSSHSYPMACFGNGVSPPKPSDPDASYSARNGSMATCICRAALKAVFAAKAQEEKCKT